MVGQSISHYKILEKIGEGGMGVVYRAHDTKLDRIVALKFLPHHLTPDETEKARFLQEAKAAATLNHPNVCVIYDIKEENGQQFIVMEFVDGDTLRTRITDHHSKGTTFPLQLVVDWGLQIADALAAAHEKGIVHRDIKADNIMVNSKNQIKITDFGLAKLKGSLKLTRTSSTVGTLAYMAPEQIQGGEVDARSDIFSFGVALYEMLTNRLPFRGEHEAAMIYSIVNEEQAPVERIRPEVSHELVHILNRALEKDPNDRYQTVSDMVIDLRRLKKETSKVSRKSLAEMKVPETPSTPEGPVRVETSPVPVKRKPRLFLLAGAIAAVAIMGVIAYLLLGRQAEIPERIPVAVADFVNQTKEDELDGLSGMLITSLEQSRRLAVLTRSRMFDILKQMGRNNVDRIDEALGREICRQANVNALVVASVRKFDQLYIIDLKILDPIKNEYLFTGKEEGQGKASVPSMIDKLSEKTRVGLKEKVAEIKVAKKKVADVTTTNLQAYHHYFQGDQLINKLQFQEAAREFRKAVAIDTTFALAYYRLAYALAWNQSPGADEAIQKAMLYLDRVPEKERYYIRGEEAVVQKNIRQGLAIYKELLNLYPDEKEALYLIGDYSFHQSDYPVAIAHLEKVLAMDPTFERAYQHLSWALTFTGDFRQKLDVAKQYVERVPNEESYSLLADAYVNQEMFDSALTIYNRARELFRTSTMPAVGIGQTHIFLDNFQAAKAEFNKLISATQPMTHRREGYRNLMYLFIHRGQYRDALSMLDKIIELDAIADNKSELASSYVTKALWIMFLENDKESARQTLEKGLSIQKTGDIMFSIPLFHAYLAMGEFEEALSVGKTLAVVFPHFEDIVAASMHMAKGEFYAAIQKILAVPLNVPIQNELPLYKLAECYIEAGQMDKALEALQKIEKSYSNYFSYRGFGLDFRPGVYPKSLYLIGKIYEMNGNKKSALENYQKFLILWKDADKHLPEPVDAKRRLAKLKGTA